jgi:hypothetical protein
MANRSFYRGTTNFYDRELVKLIGIINVNASNAVTTNTLTGLASASRTAAGTYSLVFTDAFVSLKSAQIQLQAAAAIDRTIQVISWTPATKTLVFAELAAGVATDLGAAHAVYCEITFSNV